MPLSERTMARLGLGGTARTQPATTAPAPTRGLRPETMARLGIGTDPAEEPEQPGIIRRAAGAVADVAEAAGELIPSPIKAGLQAAGALTGKLGEAVLPDAYNRAYEQNLQSIDKDGDPDAFEKVRAAPGIGTTIAEAISPAAGRQPGWGSAAATAGALVGDIVTDPTTYLTGGLGTAGKLGKLALTGKRAADIAPEVGRGAAAIGAASRVIGSPAAGLIYAPEVLGGGARAIEQGDFATAALLGGLGGLMGHGVAREAGALRAQPPAVTPDAPVMEPRLPGEAPPFPEASPGTVEPMTAEPPPDFGSDGVELPSMRPDEAPFPDAPSDGPVLPETMAPEAAPFPVEPTNSDLWAGDAPEVSTPDAPTIPDPLVAQQPLQEPGVSFAEQTPLPRDGDRRMATEPTATDRRLAQRRSEFAQKFGLPEEHQAVAEAVQLHTDLRTDQLTGLHNQRGWDEIVSTKTEADQVLAMDGKQFKKLNDTYGHKAGDAVLKTFGGVLRKVVGDESARPHGDEFMALLRNSTPEQADAMIARLQTEAATARTKFTNPATGEVVDIPPMEVHIARGTSEDAADLAVNVVAAESRKGGRGDVPPADPNRVTSDAAAPGPLGAGLDSGRVVEPALSAESKPAQSIPPKDRRLFDRTAAMERMKTRGKKISLGVDPAESVGAIRDLAEVGASYIEDYARSFKGKIPDFELWGRTVGRALSGVVENVGKHLRRIYDEAVRLYKESGFSFGALEKEPRGVVLGSLGGVLQPSGPTPPKMPPPKMPKEAKAPTPQPLPPGAQVKVPEVAPAAPPTPPAKPEPIGRPMFPAEAPRVDAKVEALKEVAPDAKLSRDKPRSWESLDPEIRTKLEDVTASPEKEAALYEKARSGKINDVEVQALDALVAGKRQKYDETRQQLLKAQSEGKDAGPDSVQYLSAALDQVAADLATAARSDVEAGTKLARALAARARIMQAKVSATDPDTFLRRVFREIPDVSDSHAAELVKVLRETPAKLGDALHAAVKPKALSKWLEAWKAGLVSGPGTQIANLAGNVGEQQVRVGETLVASLVDKLIGGPQTRMSGEAKWEVAGQLAGARRGFGSLKTALRDIVTLAPEKIDLTQPLERQVGSISGKKGRAIRIPFRLLSAFDDMFKSIGGEAELYKRAYRAAKGNAAEAERLIGRDAEDVPALLREFSGSGDEIKANVLERVFQDPQKMADVIIQARNRVPLLHLVAPFAQTPSSIFARTIERSPFGFPAGFKALNEYRAALRSGADAETVAKLKGVAVDKLSRPLVGTIILGGFVGVAKAGGMTGGGPTDPKEKYALQESGWQPYSFKVTLGDGKTAYLPFNRFEPVSSILGFAADMAEAGEAKEAGDLLDKALGSLAQNLTSKTYLQGLADAAEAINNPRQFMGQYASNLAGSFVPNIVAKTAQAIDPTIRDVRPESSGLSGIPERIGNTIASRIPGLSTTLPSRKSGTGETAERRGNALTRFASPVQPSLVEADLPFKQKLVDLDAVPSAPPRDIKVRGKAVRLNDDEMAIISKHDSKTTAALQKILNGPAFKRADEGEQKRIVSNHYNRGRSNARNEILRSASFAKRAREAVRKKES